ncbi:hypothetical protein LSTR_LSTR008393 [Laodelphax striatellus]|uniref:CFAP74 third Ig-like domain-containing protein n=1 Tax=Laodelphax striatellus TaxID=195883 RepID=A0A482XV23_LAOST|nr:hypothetical protein LSTR_LSTR008393 [Laodelphax striatellus]
MTLKRRSKISTPICNHYRWRNISLAKKLESFRLLRDAIENTKAKVVEPECCHTQIKPSKTTQKDGLAPPPTLSEEIHNDNVQAKLQALEIMEVAKKRKQCERKMEIIKRLLFEQKLRKNVNPSAKLRGRKRQKPIPKCVNKRLSVEKMRKSSDINKERSSESDHNFKGLSPPYTVLLKPRNDFLSLPISYFHENLEIHKAINQQFEPIHAISSDKKVIERFPVSFLEKIEQGKLNIDRGWFSQPEEIIFKYERNDPMTVYKKSVVITNTGRCLAYCGFVAVDCNMLVHPKTFTGCNNIERIYPGMTFCFELTFCTHGEIFGDLRAKAYFLTRREGLEGYMEIPVLCRPTVCENLQPSVVSTSIHFRKMNYWDKSSSQIMFLTNPLDEPCEVYFDSNTDKILGAFEENLKRLKKDKENYVLDKHYGKKIKRELSRIIASYAVEYIINNIFEPIQTIPHYFAQIPSNSKIPITIKFTPQLVNKEDFIVKKIIVNHTIRNKVFLRNEITVHAKTEGLPIVIEPYLLDFKIVLVGVCLQQTSFTVTNTGKIAVPLKVTVERPLRKFVSIRPNCLLVPAGKSTPVSVCLKIGPGFEEDANKFIDKDMRLLEFPIFIHQASNEHKDKIMTLILPAMPVLTNSFALGVSEKTVDFGTVYLSTSSLRQLKIENRSPLLQYYGFLNVPDVK